MQPGDKPQNKRLRQTSRWVRQHRLSILLIGGAAIIAIGYILAITHTPTVHNPSFGIIKPKKPTKYYSLLSGAEVPDEAASKQAVSAVMIENSPEARPQSGLKNADMVYEAVAEGGITRFMALYQHSKPEMIGPVRSLRIYYLDWAAPYQASIAHVGGSYNALQAVKNYRDIDQYFNAGTYWRTNDRHAPHNVYTSGERLNELNKAKGYDKSIFEGFKRVDPKPNTEPSATQIDVNFSSAQFNTSYSYSHQSNTYIRTLAGTPHHDREGGEITPNSIVVIKVSAVSRGGADGYEDLATSGEGQGYIFQNGTAQEITWKKTDRDTRLQLLDSEGNEVKLNRGQTWISAITPRGNVSWQ